MESEANQDLDCDLDPSKDDLPLRANTNHMLVRHYVLDLTVCFSSEVISGSVVLFLEPGKGAGLRPDSSSSITDHAPGDEKASGSVGQAGGGGRDRSRTEEAGTFQDASKNVTVEGGGGGGGGNVGGDCCHSDPLPSPMAAERLSWEHRGDDDDFVLVLDCCDLVVSKVEEVHLASIPEMCSLEGGGDSCSGGASTNTLVRKLVSMPSSHWAKQQELYSLCSCAPALPGGGAIQFCTDRWSLQIRKRGFRTPQTFPLALRIWYQTKPQGASVRWTKDQSGRPCVYTQGSPINNRALFPCQEPPVAMSTWQASIHALSDCVVLLSGENKACPVLEETGFSRWDYYVTMPMPASTFTIAIGYWVEAKASPTSSTKTCPNIAMQNVGVALSKPGSLEIMTCTLGGEPGVVQKLCSEMDYSDLTDVTQTLHSEVDCFGLGSDDMNLNSGMNYSGLAKEEQTKHCGVDYSGLSTEEQNSNSGMECSGLADPESCCHSDYPCRFPDTVAQAQSVIPHRVFAPPTLLQRAESMLLPLLPHCLAAAHTTLGVHPFARLDVLIVPPGFSSLGMASPHMVFLSQSVLSGDQSLCGSRLCHEIAHSWFGLAIGARDWTEEWISEGFATYLEDIIWARAQQLSQSEAEEQWRLKASLRWRRLCDELRNSEEELQVLRPNKESTGEVSESGASIVKHALNPEKPFMQVHYLKGYFLLKFLAGKIGEDRFLRFFRLFVSKYHGQLILSQDFLQMLLGTFPDVQRQGLTIEAVYADWLDTPGIPETLQGGIEALVRSSLVEEVKEEVERWIVLGVGTGRGAKRRKVGAKVDPRELTSEQLVLLLELLLEEAELSVTSLRILERTYGLRGRDAEVRHRWCELVVKHKYTAAYGDVERFLLEDQAMGVYLYGELMLNEDGRQQALARHCFSQAHEDMDPSARIVVEEMIL